MMSPIRLAALFCLSLVLWGCQGGSSQEEKPPRRTIDPSQITIDVEVGGVRTPDQVLLQYKKTGSGPQVLLVPNATFLADDFKLLEQEYTVIYYDQRNRGRSQAVKDPEKLSAGIWNDVADLEAVRQHFQLDRFYLIGHGYLSVVAGLYARRHPEYVDGLILISPLPPQSGKAYSGPYQDSIARSVREELALLDEKPGGKNDPDYCREWWSTMKKMYVTDPLDTKKIRTNICQYPNERPDRMLPYLQAYIFPSIEQLDLKADDLAQIEAPALILHGAKDRIAPLAGAKDWAKSLPDARLVEIGNGGHFPWIEEEGPVFQAIRTFLQEH